MAQTMVITILLLAWSKFKHAGQAALFSWRCVWERSHAKPQRYSWPPSGRAMQAKNACFRNVAGQAVFRKSRVSYQQAESEISNNKAPPLPGAFMWQIVPLPFAVWLCHSLATQQSLPAPGSLVPRSLPGSAAPCIPPMLSGSCLGKQNTE